MPYSDLSETSHWWREIWKPGTPTHTRSCRQGKSTWIYFAVKLKMDCTSINISAIFGKNKFKNKTFKSNITSLVKENKINNSSKMKLELSLNEIK